jgi:serine/threonine protein kinase
MESITVEQQPTVSDFLIEATLGTGRQSTVYQALHIPTQTVVALKVANERWRNEIREEVHLLSAVAHPNIMPVLHQSAVVGEDVFFAMPVMSTIWHLSPSRVLGALEQLGQALDYAHAQGVLHRDISPSNFLISSAGDALLSDFGNGMRMNCPLKPDKFSGRMFYSAPEILAYGDRALEYTPSSDIYSFAVAARDVLTWHQLPVTTALEKGMAEEPQERFTSATELVVCLRDELKQAECASLGTSVLSLCF